MSGARLRLNNRRRAVTLDIEHAGLRFKATVGFFDDGRPAELFVSNHKAGNALDVIARDSGILVSLCLQHGCTVETISHALSRNRDGSASGIVSAVLDRIMAEIAP